MFEFMNGIVDSIESGYIVILVNNIGYKIYVPDPYSYRINEEYRVYLYEHIREDEDSLFGFKTKEERDFFLKLINVKVQYSKLYGIFETAYKDTEINDLEWYEKLIKNKVNNL